MTLALSPHPKSRRSASVAISRPSCSLDCCATAGPANRAAATMTAYTARGSAR